MRALVIFFLCFEVFAAVCRLALLGAGNHPRTIIYEAWEDASILAIQLGIIGWAIYVLTQGGCT